MNHRWKKVRVQTRYLGPHKTQPRLRYEYRCNIPREVCIGSIAKEDNPTQVLVIDIDTFEAILTKTGFCYAMRLDYEEMFGEISNGSTGLSDGD